MIPISHWQPPLLDDFPVAPASAVLPEAPPEPSGAASAVLPPVPVSAVPLPPLPLVALWGAELARPEVVSPTLR